MDLGKRGYGVLHSNLQSGFDHFIFSKQWKNGSWTSIGLNKEISEKIRSIRKNITDNEEILRLFVGDKLQL
jgi:hypothetical protein